MIDSEHISDPDENLTNLLRMIVAETSVVDDSERIPSSLTHGSMWVYDWHNADDELAVVESDSADHSAVGVRGAGAVRDMVFSADDMECEIEVSADGAGFVVAGRLVPSGEMKVTLCVASLIKSATTDEFGRFKISGLPSGSALGFVEAKGRRMRLPPFNVDHR
jgi:hypothetical protein